MRKRQINLRLRSRHYSLFIIHFSLLRLRSQRACDILAR